MIVPVHWNKISEQKPKRSDEYLVCDICGYMTIVAFSIKHQQFNTYDCQSEIEAQESALKDILWWAERPMPVGGNRYE